MLVTHLDNSVTEIFSLLFAVFGNTGLHMVLNGEVSPITHPYLNVDNGESLRAPTPLVINEPEEIVS